MGDREVVGIKIKKSDNKERQQQILTNINKPARKKEEPPAWRTSKSNATKVARGGF
jgi:hypothetical protein